jgi:hypothetical protein
MVGGEGGNGLIRRISLYGILGRRYSTAPLSITATENAGDPLGKSCEKGGTNETPPFLNMDKWFS